jgi:3-oxoacyl-[acyl-carrier protein] reductase
MGASFHKTALITGSTRGIGLAIALRLLREAYNVVINYARDDQQAQRALIRCQQESPSVLLVQADVSRKQEVDRLVQESMRAFQRIDVLINNAACVIDRPMQELTEEEWDRVIDTNLKGTFLCSQAVAPYMLAQETCKVRRSSGSDALLLMRQELRKRVFAILSLPTLVREDGRSPPHGKSLTAP